MNRWRNYFLEVLPEHDLHQELFLVKLFLPGILSAASANRNPRGHQNVWRPFLVIFYAFA